MPKLEMTLIHVHINQHKELLNVSYVTIGKNSKTRIVVALRTLRARSEWAPCLMMMPRAFQYHVLCCFAMSQ